MPHRPDPRPQSPAQHLDAAWDCLEDGRPEDALEPLAAIGDALPERWPTECIARTQLGDLAGAERALARAADELDAEDAEVLWARGELRLAQWRLNEAREAYATLERQEADAAVLERLAVLADLDGDFSAADALLERASRVDPELPAPARLTPVEFEQCVDAAAAALPPRFRAALDAMPVVLDPMPDPLMFQGRADAEPPSELLGYFVGPELSDRAQAVLELPPTIYLYQRNLERMCATRDELVDQIRITLYHELGHALGFDEEGVEDLGLA